MRAGLIVGLAIWTLGCSPPESTAVADYSYFDVRGFASSLLADQLASGKTVDKTVTANGVDETQKFATPDSAFWATDMNILLETDLNKPSLRNAYSVTLGLEDKASNLLINLYEAVNSEEVAVQAVSVFYWQEESEVRKIQISRGSSNVLSTTSQDVTCWVNKYNGVLLIDSIKSKVLSGQFGQDTSTFMTTTIVK